MKISHVMASVFVLGSASVAGAETAADRFEAEGLSGFSNLQQAIGRELMRHGVPESCLMQLSMDEVGEISAIAAGGSADDADTRTAIKRVIEDSCDA